MISIKQLNKMRTIALTYRTITDDPAIKQLSDYVIKLTQELTDNHLISKGLESKK